MISYKETFTKEEKMILNTIENEGMRLSCMSVFGIMINAATNNICDLSYKKIMKKSRKYKYSSTSMLKRRIDKLKELGLIEVTKKNKTICLVKNCYKIIRKKYVDINEENEKRNEKENEPYIPKHTENTTVIGSPNIRNIELENTIYTYIKDVDTATTITKNLLKDLKIKKEIIRNSVIARVKQVYMKIHTKGATNYITRMIINAVAYFQETSKQVNIKLKKSKGNKRKSNFKGRETICDDESLFGWDILD